MIKWQSQGDPKLFLKYNYPETRDLCKQFLTLVVAVLVFSLTLSEKVVQFQQASLPLKLSLGLAWSSMLVSVIFCGIGLTFITLAAGDAVYSKTHYLRFAAKSYNCIVLAGMCFIIGLISLIATAVMSVTTPERTSPNKPPQATAAAQSVSDGVRDPRLSGFVVAQFPAAVPELGRWAKGRIS